MLIAPYLAELLAGHRKRQMRTSPLSTLVFPSKAGTTLNYDNVRRRGHEAAVRDAGLDRALRLHDLRHSAASFWLACGESIYFVKEQFGHADIQTTIDLYGHPDREAHAAAAKRAADWWRQSGTTGGTTNGKASAGESTETRGFAATFCSRGDRI